MGSKSSGPSKAQILAEQRARMLAQQQERRQQEVEAKEQSRQTLARRRGLGRASLIATSETGTKGVLG